MIIQLQSQTVSYLIVRWNPQLVSLPHHLGEFIPATLCALVETPRYEKKGLPQQLMRGGFATAPRVWPATAQASSRSMLQNGPAYKTSASIPHHRPRFWPTRRRHTCRRWRRTGHGRQRPRQALLRYRMYTMYYHHLMIRP